MNASNRFEIETLARQQEQEIRRNLSQAGHMRDVRPAEHAPSRRSNLRAGLIVAVTALVSSALALGLSQLMVFSFAVLR